MVIYPWCSMDPISVNHHHSLPNHVPTVVFKKRINGIATCVVKDIGVRLARAITFVIARYDLQNFLSKLPNVKSMSEHLSTAGGQMIQLQAVSSPPQQQQLHICPLALQQKVSDHRQLVTPPQIIVLLPLHRQHLFSFILQHALQANGYEKTWLLIQQVPYKTYITAKEPVLSSIVVM